MGLAFSQLTNITLSAVSPQESGEASGVNNTIRQVGQSLGTAIIGTVLIASITHGMASGVQTSASISDAHRPVLEQTVRVQSSAIEFGIPVMNQRLSRAEATTLKQISDRSTVRANREALLYTAMFTALAFLLATQLPNVTLHKLEQEKSIAAGH